MRCWHSAIQQLIQ
jgi:hypothetical protein